MKYNDYLKTIVECPFCSIVPEEILKKNKFAKVILAKAPYNKDHLLVIPNSHKTKISELNSNEKKAIFELVLWAQMQLEKYHNNISILYREGNKEKIGKSVDHMHVNLIPNSQIGSVSINAKDRSILNEERYLKLTREAKEKFK